MPDISMCNGGECLIKKDCYRYTATPNKRLQSYISPPYSKEKLPFKVTHSEYCSFYLPTTEGKSE